MKLIIEQWRVKIFANEFIWSADDQGIPKEFIRKFNHTHKTIFLPNI